MKTSNIILLAFLVVVFTTPVLLFISFRNKIKKGEFAASTSSNKYRHSGPVGPFKVVKIVGPGLADVFSCHFIPADSAWYGYNNFGETDSIKVEQKGDTLLLTYINTDIEVKYGTFLNSNLAHLRIDLHVPVINNVVVEGAGIAVMDTVDAVRNPEIYFDLKDRARLSLGTGGHVKSVAVNHAKANRQAESTTVTEYEYAGAMFNKVAVKASSARVELGEFVKVKDLNLQLRGTSEVNFHYNSQIDRLNGAVSDSSTVEGNWKNVRRLDVLGL